MNTQEQSKSTGLMPETDRAKLQAFVDLVLSVKPPICESLAGSDISYQAAATLEELALKISNSIDNN